MPPASAADVEGRTPRDAPPVGNPETDLSRWESVPRDELYPRVRAAFPAWNPFWEHKLRHAVGVPEKPVRYPARYLYESILEHLAEMIAGAGPPKCRADDGEGDTPGAAKRAGNAGENRATLPSVGGTGVTHRPAGTAVLGGRASQEGTARRSRVSAWPSAAEVLAQGGAAHATV